jgi:hypothetical protein
MAPLAATASFDDIENALAQAPDRRGCGHAHWSKKMIAEPVSEVVEVAFERGGDLKHL